jgi:hypothetical protein
MDGQMMGSVRVLSEEFVRRMQPKMEQAMRQVMEAVNAAPDGAWINASEIPVRDVFGALRREAYETALQMRLDAVDQASGKRMESKGVESRSFLSVNGRSSLSRTRWFLKGRGSCSPLTELLDAALATESVGVRNLCCRLNGNGKNFERVAQNLAEAAQVVMSGEKLRQVVEAEGKRALSLARSGALGPDWMAKECQVTTAPGRKVSRVYMGSDGFMVPLVTRREKDQRREKIKGKRRKRGRKARPLPSAKPGADGPWKEFKLVTFYSQDMAHRLVSVTRGDCGAAGLLMRRDAGRIGLAAADERIGNIDGGPWIIGQIRRRMMPMTATGLDFYHLAENVHKSRRVIFGEQNEPGRQRAGQWLHIVKHEGYGPLWEKLMEERKTMRGGRRRELDRLIHYVAERKEMIRYPEFLARGWQIGSGPTESQCRVLPARTKSGGAMRWEARNAEAIIALEAMWQSNQWEAYWRMALATSN